MISIVATMSHRYDQPHFNYTRVTRMIDDGQLKGRVGYAYIGSKN